MKILYLPFIIGHFWNLNGFCFPIRSCDLFFSKSHFSSNPNTFQLGELLNHTPVINTLASKTNEIKENQTKPNQKRLKIFLTLSRAEKRNLKFFENWKKG